MVSRKKWENYFIGGDGWIPQWKFNEFVWQSKSNNMYQLSYVCYSLHRLHHTWSEVFHQLSCIIRRTLQFDAMWTRTTKPLTFPIWRRVWLWVSCILLASKQKQFEETMEKTQDNQVIGNPRRLVLKQSVANILMEKGFETVEKQCIETLTEMIQSCTYYWIRMLFEFF